MSGIQIAERLKAADIITIFRHQRPDCDALGAQFGLKYWLQENFPDKTVLALGFEQGIQGDFPVSDQADDDVIRRSTAVILDTAGKDRVDDARFAQAAYQIKIDHHPDLEPFGDLSYVDEKAAAVCEILAHLFASLEPEYSVSLRTAECLYRGLLTDTLCFRTANTTASTLAAASWLASKGIHIPELNRELFDQTLQEFSFSGFIRRSVMIRESSACVILNRQELLDWHMTGSQARNFIDDLGHVREFQTWAIFTQHEDPDDDRYDGSLRSKHIAVNEIARQYGGGGHRNAAGVKNLSRAEIDEIIEKMISAVSVCDQEFV